MRVMENITEEEAALADKYAREQGLGYSVSYDMVRAADKVAKAGANAGGDAGASTGEGVASVSVVAHASNVVASVVAGASAAVDGAGTVEECTCEIVCTCGLNG